MNVVTRSEAKSLNLHRYYTGKPCKRGHVSERYTFNSACLGCLMPVLSPQRREEIGEMKARHAKEFLDLKLKYAREDALEEELCKIARGWAQVPPK